MKIRGLYAGLPGLTSANPLLPEGDDGTSGGTAGGAGAPPAPPAPPAAGAPAAVQPGPNGFPENTPLAEMSTEHQLAYYRHWNRQNRTALEAANAELDRTRPLAEQFAALEAASRTDQERAIEAARTEASQTATAAAEAAARDRYAPVLVQARLESALAGRMTSEQVAALMPTLNVPALLGQDGLPDADRIAAFVAAIPAAAPAVPPPPPQLGGGRTTPPSTGGTQAGADLYAQRHTKRAGA